MVATLSDLEGFVLTDEYMFRDSGEVAPAQFAAQRALYTLGWSLQSRKLGRHDSSVSASYVRGFEKATVFSCPDRFAAYDVPHEGILQLKVHAKSRDEVLGSMEAIRKAFKPLYEYSHHDVDPLFERYSL